MSAVVNIKNKIKSVLDQLKSEEIIAEVQVDDFKKGVLEREYGKFPAVVMMTPSIQGDYLTNTQNIRAYIYELVVICKGEDISDPAEVEELAETIIDRFDNIPSMEGVADAGLEPSSSPAEAVTSRAGTLVVFTVILKARVVKDLTL